MSMIARYVSIKELEEPRHEGTMLTQQSVITCPKYNAGILADSQLYVACFVIYKSQSRLFWILIA